MANPPALLSDEPRLLWLGTNTILIKTNQASLLIDPYFSRYPISSTGSLLFKKVKPDIPAIRKALSAFKIEKTDAILLTHTHLDHALDACAVAELTDAEIICAPAQLHKTALNSFTPDNLIDPKLNNSFTIKDVSLQVFTGRHMPFPYGLQHLDILLAQSLGNMFELNYACQYTALELYSFYLKTSGHSIFIMGSAGLPRFDAEQIYAQTIVLSIGGLDLLPGKYCDKLLQKLVKMQPERILLSHWDDFTKALDRPLQWLSNANHIADHIIDQTRSHNIETSLLPPGEPIALF